MTNKTAVDDFLSQRALAVVGWPSASRGGKKFGNVAYRELKSKGYYAFPWSWGVLGKLIK